MEHKLFMKLPKIDQILMNASIVTLLEKYPREQVADVVRNEVDFLRCKIINGDDSLCEEHLTIEHVVETVIKKMNSSNKSLRRVLNGTGVVLHTNLGRANLSKRALEAIEDVATSYSTLEYDYLNGCRGSRHDHVEKIICRITGAEAAMVVNNNAAATMLCLASIGKGKEIVISRGELVEIGGSFRVPEIMEESGAFLAEVGTTNKTKLSDYRSKINENTGAILKVHTSNYKIIGFTESVSIEELSNLAKANGLPLIYDMGCGLLIDLSKYGILEPDVKNGLRAGADVILFSGDKLLGGPQGGIIAGKKHLIDAMKRHPLARVLRVDKLTLAALEATFSEYYSEENAKKNVPVLKMLTESYEELVRKAEKLKTIIEEKCSKFEIEIKDTTNKVGGGSAPTSLLKGVALKISCNGISAEELEEMLRIQEIPTICRINHGETLIELRTLMEEDFSIIANQLSNIENEVNI